MNLESTTSVSPRWLHALAVLTVFLTLPLLFLGAGVTSHGVGMVDPRGFRWPWEIIRGLLENNGLAWLLEYGHRTCAFLVGFCGIGLAVGCWFHQRTWLRWMGFVALAMICVQGALGASRVDYNALYGREFALIHGIFAQLVVAVLVSVAVFTSRRWTKENEPMEVISPSLQRWTIVTVLVVFGQLILGGMVRHSGSLVGPRGHLLGAFVVVGAVLWLLKLMRESDLASPLLSGEGSGVREQRDLTDFLTRGPSPKRRGAFTVQRVLLMTLLTLQLLLGVESWLAKFPSNPYADLPQLAPMPMHSEWIRTLHYLVGTLIFSTTVVAALVAYRKPMSVTEAVLVPAHEWEAAR